MDKNDKKKKELPVVRQEIVQVPQIPEGMNMEKRIEEAEKALDLMKRMKSVTLKLTNYNDWILEHGTPYLQINGAYKLARQFRISIMNTIGEKTIEEDEKGKYYLWTFIADFVNQEGVSIQAIGVCSSRDSFFGTEKGKLKAIYDVLQENIKKKALTNCYNNGIKAILGIKSITIEDLQQVGIDLSKSVSVDYATTEKTITEKQSKLLWVKITQFEKLSGMKGTEEKIKKQYKIKHLKEMLKKNFKKELENLQNAIADLEGKGDDPSAITELTGE